MTSADLTLVNVLIVLIIHLLGWMGGMLVMGKLFVRKDMCAIKHDSLAPRLDRFEETLKSLFGKIDELRQELALKR